MTGQVYKILSRETWRAARAAGIVPLHGLDAQDCFVHLSTGAQLRETLRLHFVGQDYLVVLAFDADDLEAGLRWEVSRGDQTFPHYFGVLSTELVRATHEVSGDNADFVMSQALIRRIS